MKRPSCMLAALSILILIGGCARTTLPTPASPAPSLDGNAALDAAIQRYLSVATARNPADGQPRSTDSTGRWRVVPVNDWTSAFFPGTLWHLFLHTGDARLRNEAERWTWPLAAIPRGRYTHDLGFQFNSSFLNAYRFTSEHRFRIPALNAARLLAARFSPVVGAIKSWDWTDPKRSFPVIVDNMMNLELLFWGARQPDGDRQWKDIALKHARTTIANHLRPDGGSHHVVVFDSTTGRALERITHQGFADSTTWARGQAWLIYGFTMAYRESGEPEFLETAQRVADYALARLPADGVPCWDYQATGCPVTAKRDASAAAIMASALLELSTYVPMPATSYRAVAERILETLAGPAYLAPEGQSEALLLHGVGHHPNGTEIDVGLSYADYYFVEALMRHRELSGAGRRVLQPRTPRTITRRGELLREARERIVRGDRALMPALRRLTREADSAAQLTPFTVTAKRRTPPSGDKHDYMSFGPYWWPDSTKPNGLPYIRRDGEVNWDLRGDSDALRLYAMTDAVETLALAYYFTNSARYAERAATFLRTWFIDPATRMNPHLRYAQAIPGVSEGRGIGIIDTRDLGRVTDATALLAGSVAWTAELDRDVRAWMAEYLDWLKTSEHGRDEAAERNNHGTWYDVQVVALSLFTGDTATARLVAEQARTKRIAAQIDSLGRQPLETARTRSLHYSVENLDAMTRLADMAQSLGVDLWNWEARNGASIRKAIAFVAPFAAAREQWPFQQITTERADLFMPLLRRAGIAVTDTTALARTHRSQLLYPRPERVSCDLDCVLVTQVMVAGRRTGWPEKSALSVLRTLEIMRSLMAIQAPSARVKTAVHGAAAWLKESALYPGPVWARFYDARTASPLGAERISSEPLDVLTEYDRWTRRQLSTPVKHRRESHDALVDANYTGPEGNQINDVRLYQSISRALDNAPENSDRAYVIRIRNGQYYEKLSVEKPNVHLVGESRDRTVLTYDAAAATAAPSGGTYGTRGSATLRIGAPDFRLENMTVENGFDYMSNYVKPDSDASKLRATQGVAVMLDNGSDRAVFENCIISGHQDTLFPNAGRSYFHGCTILGSVDFIFGAGRAVFDSVDIVSRDRGSTTNNGYVTAPSTPGSRPYGFVIVNSRLKKEAPTMTPHTVTLGRPWHPAGDPDAVGSAVFINTWLDDHIGSKGWTSMNSTNAVGARVTHAPEEARFFEFGSTGPGALLSASRRVLTAPEAATYTIDRVLEGWNPVADR